MTVPDSILIEAGESYAHFSIAAGDTVGSARGKAELYVSNLHVGEIAETAIYLVDAIAQSLRETTIPIAMQLVSDRPNIADPAGSTFEFPANQGYHYVTAILGVSPGSANIRAVDTRTGDFRQMLSESRAIDVYPASV